VSFLLKAVGDVGEPAAGAFFPPFLNPLKKELMTRALWLPS
jgi:hypothetical protein